ncbi:hypothetical protein [Dyella sp.]|uniref:hypothetical protein n=1 Tax=Dyella sp. TaxID=1869338 RepID=UPI00321756BA
MTSRDWRKPRRVLLAFALAICSFPAWSQSAAVKPEDEYKKKIKVTEDIQPLGENPFGESISLYNGSLSFMQTDVSAAGIGPLLQLSRSFHIADVDPTYSYQEFLNNTLVDWGLDVPRIETLSANYKWSDTGGQLHTGWFFRDNTQRCSILATAPDIVVDTKAGFEPVTYSSSDWWHGYQMITPGSSQDLMKRDAGNTLAPQMTVPGTSSTSFPIVTKDHWSIGCLAQTANGQPGEGFFAVSPDGTKYWFDWFAYKIGESMVRNGGGSLHRQVDTMLVSRIEDRFGNSLSYSYDANGNLTQILGSDGRKLTLSYEVWQRPEKDPFGNYYAPPSYRLHSATLQPDSPNARIWNYSYSSDPHIPRLTAVTQPDGSNWSFNLGGFRAPSLDNLAGSPEVGGCFSVNAYTGASSQGSITHPSGLTGTFTVMSRVRGRSYTPNVCIQSPSGDFTLVPDAYVVAALSQKKFSGAGMADQVWTYGYSPANESKIEDCSAGCASSVWTDVTDPAGKGVRYTFSNKYDFTDSQLQRTDFYAQGIGSNVLRSEVNTYAMYSSGPWPVRFGDDPQRRLNDDQLETQSPLSRRDIQQDGDTYTWLAISFNEYAQATTVKRFNSFSSFNIDHPVQEQTTYLNDLPHWVLGLPAQVDITYDGKTETTDKYDYDPGSVTLSQRYRFGQAVMSYTFNAQGQLASFTDGNHHSTTLGNYKRGIPQSIGYPDSTTQSLVVDDFGQIASITDQAGSTTSYAYDAIGRIHRIDYPSGDEVAWLPKTFDYAFVGAAEQGVPANHWRRTSTKGSAVTTTYFDAMLRPVLSRTAIAGTSINARTDYDWKGQKTFVSYPVNGTPDLGTITAGTTSTYDALGRLTQTQQTSELGTLTALTAYLSGARKQVTDPKNNVTITSYQVFDQPGYDAVIQVQAPEGINQAITRDVYGNPLAIHQWGSANGFSNDATKTLAYDSYHRLCRTSEPESGSEVTAYDDANNVAWTAAGLSISGDGCGTEQVAVAAQTKRSYDTMNRVLRLDPPAGTQNTVYSYDLLGNLQTANSGVTYWTGYRNKLGLLTGESLQVAGQDLWRMGYAHDAYGAISTIQYPDGEAISYAPDALGRATQVGSYATGVSYYPDGDVASFTFGNGDSYAVQKNARLLLSNFTYGNGGTLKLSEDYAYDNNGNITAITDLTDGTRTKSFGYDALNRLTQAQASHLWGSESYGYDPLNNIASRISGGQTFTYNYDGSKRLASITQGGSNVITLGYDNRGNVNNRNGVTLNFDQKNQLTDIPGYDSYQYDASGRRVVKNPTSGTGATYYFYTQAGQLVYAFDAGTSKATNYVYLGKKLIARNESLKLSNPAGISFSANPNAGNYTVSWTAVPGATGYNLQVSADGGTTWNVAGSGMLATTSLAVINQDGGSYMYRVQACAASSCVGGWTVSQNLGVTPAAPVITVPGSIVNGNYTVSWTAPVSATSYDVQEAVNGGAWTSIATGTTATSISRPGTSGGSYTYQVQAKNSYGTRGWVTSNAVTVDTTYGVVPPAPASLTVPAASADGNVSLSWAAVSQITHYVVQQSSDGGTNWSGIYDGTATTTAMSGLANGSYQYRVEACNAYNCSAWQNGSNALVVTHPPTGVPTLTAPANSTNGSFTISWTAVSTATSYTLQESVNGGGTWTQVQANGNTSWPTSGRGNGNYSYRVQACNVGGCASGWSSTGTTTVLLPPPTPTGITVPATSNGPISVSWNASPTATRYDLYQNINNAGWTLAASVSSTSVTVTATTSGTYLFFVAAYNASGWNGAVNNSSQVTVTIPPSAAPNLSTPGSSSTGSYTVSWSAVSGATSYNLQEQLNGGGWTQVQASGASSWGASGRGNGTWGYRVQGCNAGGCGPWSATANTVVTLIPPTPTGLTLSTSGAVNKPVVHVSWNASAGATVYNVEETHPQDGVFILYSGPNTNTGSQITADGSVKFRVQACNSSGCSAWSSYASVWLASGA